MYHAACYASRSMSVLRHFKHAVLLVLSVGCADPGASAIATGNRAAREGRFAEAVVAFQQACDEAPQHARAHALLANAYWAAGKPVDAVAAWTKALERDPNQIEATLGLARSEIQAGATAVAIARLTAALRVAPARSDLFTARALALMRRDAEGDRVKATEDSEAAFGLSPHDPDVLYTWGSVLIAAKRFNEAQSAFDALDRVSPRSPMPPYGLARLAAAQSRKTDVLLHLRAARATAEPARWTSMAVIDDPAFAFLKHDPDFLKEVAPR